MNKLNKTICAAMALFGTMTLASCSSYELLYQYYDEFDGYVVYAQESTLSRYNLRDNIEIPDAYSYKAVIGVSPYTFYDCNYLKEVKLPSKIKQIGSYSFSKCYSMSYIGLPKSLEVIDNCAFKESGLKKVYIPSKVSFVGMGAFASCPLESIIIEEDNAIFDTTENINAIINVEDKKLVSGCKNTIIPDYVTTIGAYSFYGIKMESISIPDSVEEILNYAFYNSSLKEINISNNVKNIENKAFSTNIKVNYAGTIDEFKGIFHCVIEDAKGLVVSCSDGTYTYS